MLTADVDYEKWADYLEEIMNKCGKNRDIILELACGTGSLSRLMCKRGYDIISVDNSEDMLNVAREKCEGEQGLPLFLCQNMCELDLYGTVDITMCCLDSVNYITYMNDLKRMFKRVALFTNPKGLFIFDIKTIGFFKKLKGQMNAVSTEDGFYFWQYDYDSKSRLCQHNVEIFQKIGNSYERYEEIHFQRAYSFAEIENAFKGTGFEIIGRFKNLTFKKADKEEDRVFFVARKA